VNNDGNGKYEWLTVQVGLTATQPGTYLLAGDLVGGDGAVVAHSVISVTLPAGTSSANLPFNGDDIRRSGASGVYTLTNLMVSDQGHAGLPAIIQAQDVWATGPHDSTNYATTCYLLVLNANGGSITTEPPPDCLGGQFYSSGTEVTLIPVPDSGQAFDGWAGDVAGTTAPATLTMNGDKNVEALFVAAPATPTTAAPTGTPGTALPTATPGTALPTVTPGTTPAAPAMHLVFLPLTGR
jgi:hypothetical protein